MTPDLFKIIRRDLEVRKQDATTIEATKDVSFIKIVQRMLAWTVQQRSSAAEALDVFKEIYEDRDEQPERDSGGSRVKQQQTKKLAAIGS